MEKGSAVPLVESALKADGHDLNICAAAIFFDMWEPLGSRQISVSRFPVVSLFKRHDIGLSRDCFDAQPPLMKGTAPDFISEPKWWRFDFNPDKFNMVKSAPVIVDDAVAGDVAALGEQPRGTMVVGQRPARAGQNQRAGGDVPDLQVERPVGVHAAGRYVA